MILLIIVLATAALALLAVLRERTLRQTRAVPPGLQSDVTLPYNAEWTLYHNPFSLCSKKIRVCMAEYGVPYDSISIDLIETGGYQNISRDFLKVNPGATVPVLLHNGHPIYESHEQLNYVAGRVDEAGLLMPHGPEQKEVMAAWVHKTSLLGDHPIESPEATAGNAVAGLTIPIFASMVAKIPVLKIFEGLLFHRIKQRVFFFLLMKLTGLSKTLTLKPVNQIIHRADRAMAAHLIDLEHQLDQSGGPWICGQQFTLADVGMMVIFDRLREGDWLTRSLDDRPVLQRYWAALQQRPSYRQGCLEFAHPAVTEATQALVEIKRSGRWPSGLPQ
ncbi:MAG: glutathione S-transferase family protein [OM182 bacterium]|nr:MAG: glutathione S-transferase family protein [OM182 bacterium]